jgi:uncharacterized protein YydD (DUF2326 family)
MFLKTLKVEKSGKVIREVKFKIGLNLVIDETPSNDLTKSGNNVGKTTLLRVIDYCLGGKIERIYTDKETGSENEEVKNFLLSPTTTVTLEISNGVDNIKIQRSHELPITLNTEEISDNEFQVELGKQLFKLKSNKPSLRQVLNKFIRVESYQVENIFKFMYPTTSDDVYEYLYLYLFGFTNHEVAKRKDTLNRELKKLAKQRTGLKGISKGALKQIVKTMDRELSSLKKKVDNFEVTDSINKEVKELEDIRTNVSDLSIRASDISTRLSLSEETLGNLASSKENIDPSDVRDVYDSAGALLGSVSKDFQEVLNFHNSMIENKIKFVRSSMRDLLEAKKTIEAKVSEFTKKEQGILKSISQKGALADYQKLNVEYSELKEKRGEKAGLLEELNKLEVQEKLMKDSLDNVTNELLGYREKLDIAIEKFNVYYTDFSNKMYKEKYVLSYDNDEHGNFTFNVTAMKGAVGTGKKKGQISAFDLAYLKYLEERNANTCRFQLNDRMEEVSINQLKTSFEIANSIKGQFVVSILKDKIRDLGDEFISANEVLTLSEQEKFFKIH